MDIHSHFERCVKLFRRGAFLLVFAAWGLYYLDYLKYGSPLELAFLCAAVPIYLGLAWVCCLNTSYCPSCGNKVSVSICTLDPNANDRQFVVGLRVFLFLISGALTVVENFIDDIAVRYRCKSFCSFQLVAALREK